MQTDSGMNEEKCAPNSYCYSTTVPNGECRCHGQLQPNNQGRCFLEPGQVCNIFNDECDYTEFQECAADMTSGGFKCGCTTSENLVAESAGRCRIQADSPCSNDLGAQKCTTYAKCMEVADEYWCVCAAGLIVNMVGRRVIAYALPCGPAHVGTCDGDRFQSCYPPDAPEGQCLCSDLYNMVYDNHEKNVTSKLVIHAALVHYCNAQIMPSAVLAVACARRITWTMVMDDACHSGGRILQTLLGSSGGNGPIGTFI